MAPLLPYEWECLCRPCSPKRTLLFTKLTFILAVLPDIEHTYLITVIFVVL